LSGLIEEGGDELMAEILIGSPFTHYLKSYRSHNEFKNCLTVPDRNLAAGRQREANSLGAFVEKLKVSA
jgi:hypothetical protein